MTDDSTVDPGTPQGSMPRGSNPFPGPRAYRNDDQTYFFGRTEEMEELTSLVLSSSATLVFAPSGAGKSSLLQAGVAPHLERRFDFVVLPTVRLGTGSRPNSTDEASNPFISAVCETISTGTTPAPTDIAEAAATRRPDSSRRVLLILDQFEEVFTDPALWRQREDFFTALTSALEKNTWLRAVIALRSDYLADLIPHERNLPANLVVRYQLESLDEQQASDAIAAAFAASGLSLSDADVRVVLDALLEDPARPPEWHNVRGQHVNTVQLQIVCRRLWDELRDLPREGPGHRLLTAKTFSAHTSMSQFVDNAISEAVRRSKGDEAAIRRWISTNLITSSGRRAFVLVDEQQTAGLPNSVIDALEAVRLIQLEQRHGLRLAELTHDSMTAAVEASNQAWMRSRAMRRRRLSGVLLAMLIGLVAAFPLLQIDREEVIAGSDIVGDSPARLTFPGQRRGVVVDVTLRGPLGGPPAQLQVLDVDATGRERRLDPVPIPMSPEFQSTSVPVTTSPGHTYAAVLTAPNAQFSLAVRSLPTLQASERTAHLVLSPRIAVMVPPGSLRLITASGLNGVTGVSPIALAPDEDWVLIRGSSSPQTAVLVLDPRTTDDPLQPTVIQRQDIQQPESVGPGESVVVEVRPVGMASLTTSPDKQPAGAQVQCSDPVKARVVYGTVEPGAVPSQSVDVGRGRVVVLPVNLLRTGGSRAQLLLYASTEAGATCTVGMRSFSGPAVTTFGPQKLVMPRSTDVTAFRIALPNETMLIVNKDRRAEASLECASPTYRFAQSYLTQDKQFASIPKGMTCDLWLVRKGDSTDSLSLPIWVVDTSPAEGR